ncbi:O-antigen ligase domain-containing protein [bacterium]|nr:MAG: O-antigen ligase domain-containing protein [bacterium]
MITISELRQKNIFFWLALILGELAIAFTTFIASYYVFIVLGMALVIFLILIYPEVSYYLLTLTFVNHVIQLTIPSYNFMLIDFLSFIFTFIVLAAWTLARMSKIRMGHPGSPLTLQMAFFMAWAVLSLLWVLEYSAGLLELTVLASGYLTYYVSVAIIRTKKVFNTVILLLIFLGLVNSILAFYTVYSSESQYIYKEIFSYDGFVLAFTFNSLPKARGSGLSYTQATALFLNIAIMYGISLFFIETIRSRKIIIVLIVLFMISANLTTLSKGGLMGLFAGLTVFVLGKKPLRRRFLLTTACIILTMVLLFMLSRLDNLGKAFTEGVAGTLTEAGGTSLPTRLLYWGKGFDDMLSNYGFGTGIGNFYYLTGTSRFHAHSMYFSVIFAFGFIGLILWAWLCVKTLYISISGLLNCEDMYFKNMLLGFIAGLMSIFAFGLVDLMFWATVLWTFLGIGMALLNISKRSSEKTISAGSI